MAKRRVRRATGSVQPVAAFGDAAPVLLEVAAAEEATDWLALDL